MSQVKKTIAEKLIQIKAIKLQPTNPFTWASGWKSPIYCDNRLTLSYSDIRQLIRDEFVNQIRKNYPDVEVIAGVATGAIAQGIMVAEAMNLPFVYVRPSAKVHGMGNQIEGYLPDNKKVVVIEDLISTGGSSLKAVQSLREAGADVLGMVAIFTYDFPVAQNNFKEANCKLITLSDYHALLEYAISVSYVEENQLDTLQEWRKDPSVWQQ
jgi:orotate phosphoribosyltransferase